MFLYDTFWTYKLKRKKRKKKEINFASIYEKCFLFFATTLSVTSPLIGGDLCILDYSHIGNNNKRGLLDGKSILRTSPFIICYLTMFKVLNLGAVVASVNITSVREFSIDCSIKINSVSILQVNQKKIWVLHPGGNRGCLEREYRVYTIIFIVNMFLSHIHIVIYALVPVLVHISSGIYTCCWIYVVTYIIM